MHTALQIVSTEVVANFLQVFLNVSRDSMCILSSLTDDIPEEELGRGGANTTLLASMSVLRTKKKTRR